MPEYIVVLSKNAQKKLDKMSDFIAAPILEAIAALAKDPRPHGCKKLKGRPAYRIRIGNYRIIYDVFDKELIVDVITLGDRKNVYDD